LVEKYKAKKMLLEDVKVLRPIKKMYSTDNAAMIGVV
jgi:tRNA A37 threonylcarbamoyltransferase TsaD